MNPPQEPSLARLSLTTIVMAGLTSIFVSTPTIKGQGSTGILAVTTTPKMAAEFSAAQQS